MRKIKKLIWFTINYFQFRIIGLGSFIDSPVKKIRGKKYITLGKSSFVGFNSWISAIPINKNDDCNLIIGDNTAIGHFCHIYATKLINIEKNVLIADKVYISDNTHSFENVNVPIINQPVKQMQTVTISEGAWIGEGVCIIGANVGKNSIIGANSTVTKNIPDYVVAVGSPAKVIKIYDFKTSQWIQAF